jgi:hypothetical protein
MGGQRRLGIWSNMRLGQDGEVDQDSGSFNLVAFTPTDDNLIPVTYELRAVDPTPPCRLQAVESLAEGLATAV